MQRLGAKAIFWSALTLIAAGAVGGTGCTAKKPTELVPGVSSQMVVPKDLVAVSIQVQANGEQVFCRGYQVSPETHVVDLPSTLGVLPGQGPDTVVTITVRGYDSSTNSADWDDCSVQVDQTNNNDGVNPPRILRQSTQTYVDQHELFLPMPLSYSCVDKDCSSTPGATCKANQCVDSKTDVTTLPDFDPTLLDGTGLCFSPSQCFPQGVTFPAATVDASACIYSLPSYATSAAITSGVNVKVFYQDWTWQPNTAVKGQPYERIVANAGEEEILNEDPADCGEPTGSDGKVHPACEGFKVLPPLAGVGAPEGSADGLASFPLDAGVEASLPYNPAALRVQLAPGLCGLVQAGTTPPDAPNDGSSSTYHTISDILLSGVCQPKLPLLPICANERNNNPVLADAGTTGDGVCNVGVPLSPAPSILYLVMDDTAVMHGALGPGGSVTELALSFNDPVFKRTYAGFKYMTYNDQGASCTSATTAYTTPDEPKCTMSASGALVCDFDLISAVQPLVATELASWVIPANEVTAGDAGLGDSGLVGVLCYSDSDCVDAGAGTYCAKPNPPVPDGGGIDAGVPEDAGDDGGGATQGVCTNPQALDLAAAMRVDVGAYAQVSQFAQNLPPPGVAGVMFFVNRVPEVPPLGAPPGADGGAIEGGTGLEGGSGIAPFPSPIAAQDCPSVATGGGGGASTPGDQGSVPDQVLQAQQLIENEALSAYTTQGIQTYFVVLDNDRHDGTALAFYQQVQTDLTQASGAQPVVTLNTRDVGQNTTNEAAAISELGTFSQIITKLGTCLYEIPQIPAENLTASTDPTTIQIQYDARPALQGTPPLPPGSNPPVTIAYDPNCNQAAALGESDAGTGPNGWNFDTGRIRICGPSCDNLRNVVDGVSALAIQNGVPIPDVPVTITPLCTGTSGSSDATVAGD